MNCADCARRSVSASHLAKILNHWEAWTSGAADPNGGGDAYWWL